jgi:hypothetical protein
LNQPQLKYPEDDVKALALELRSAGYEVQELVGKSATRDSVNAAMQRISKRGTSDDVLILGFFGHGVQYGDSAYYCPYDTDLRTAKDDDDNELRDKGGLLLQEPDPATMVSMRDMLDTLTISKTGSRLLLSGGSESSASWIASASIWRRSSGESDSWELRGIVCLWGWAAGLRG